MREEQLNIFIGKSSNYYLGKFNDINDSKKTSINMSAFFGGILWVFYRKMYKYGFIIIGIVILEALIFNLFNVSTELKKIFKFYTPLIGNFILAFYGNWLYKRHTLKQINKIQKVSVDKSDLQKQLRKRGGVSYLPFLIFVILICIVAVTKYKHR